MANLKALRQRIKSVQNTQKITRAMRLVAAAKVRRAQARTLAARPFTAGVVKLLQQVVFETNSIDLQDIPLLQKHKTDNKVGLLIITADRGLCGGYNSNVIKEALRRIEFHKKQGKEVSLILVGLKAAGFFKRVKVNKCKNAEGKDATFTLLPAVPSVEEAKAISKVACDLYIKGELDQVEVIGTVFKNMLTQTVKVWKFLPIELPEGEDYHMHSSETLFEPTIDELMEKELLPKYVENSIYQALLEASASELAARMNAMSNATNNAKELIQDLSLVYNKARQASITQELLEIVGGADALKG